MLLLCLSCYTLRLLVSFLSFLGTFVSSCLDVFPYVRQNLFTTELSVKSISVVFLNGDF